MEENIKVAFLDVLVIRKNNTLNELYIERKHLTEFIYIRYLSRPQLGNVAHYIQLLQEPTESAQFKNI